MEIYVYILYIYYIYMCIRKTYEVSEGKGTMYMERSEAGQDGIIPVEKDIYTSGVGVGEGPLAEVDNWLPETTTRKVTSNRVTLHFEEEAKDGMNHGDSIYDML